MPILKYTASADTSITNAFKPFLTTRAVYSNMGSADSLEMFSISSSFGGPEKSRILVKFPISEISSSRVSGKIPLSGNVDFIFRLFNVQHPEILPKNYYAIIKPISGSAVWDEGFGLDIETHTDLGRSGSIGFGTNWIYRNDDTNWINEGGDYYNTYNKSYYFDNGTEDIELNITDIVEAQIAGTIQDLGLGIMLSGAYEDGTLDKTFYTKRFSARSSEYFYKRPALEVRWKSTINDNRGNFYYKSNNLSDGDNIQNLYFYNRVNGVLKDLPNSAIPFVKIFDEEETLLTSSILSQKISTGIYSASFSITGAVEQTLKDVWYSGSYAYYTGSIEAKVRTFDDKSISNEKIISITNLRNVYKNYEKPALRVYIREKNWSPNVYKIAYQTIDTLTLNNLYFKIFRIVDKLTIIDYGISPIAYTLCSYDKNGNYFDLDMSMLEPGYAYGIKFMTLEDDIKNEFTDIFRFKVE